MNRHSKEKVKCYCCDSPLDGWGKESPLDQERVCDVCYAKDKYVDDNTDWNNPINEKMTWKNY